MGISSSDISQVFDDTEILLVRLEWRQTLSQGLQGSRFGGVKSFFGEPVADPTKDHPGGRLGRSSGQRSHAFKHGQSKQGASRSQKVSSRDRWNLRFIYHSFALEELAVRNSLEIKEGSRKSSLISF